MELKNGAKETRTPDPLHAMQVLYQLSYGPIELAGAACGPACLQKAYTLKGACPQSWRQTATSFPWMTTCSASSSIGA